MSDTISQELKRQRRHVWDDQGACVHCGRDYFDGYFNIVRWLGADKCPGPNEQGSEDIRPSGVEEWQ